MEIEEFLFVDPTGPISGRVSLFRSQDSAGHRQHPTSKESIPGKQKTPIRQILRPHTHS